MYSDLLFNFLQMTENSGTAYGAEILSQMAQSKPLFALDSGVSVQDIWQRSVLLKDCIDLIDDESEKKTAGQMIYLAAGIMPDYDSVEKRYDYVESLEETIRDFKSSDYPFADRLVAIGPCGIDHDWESVEYEGRAHDWFDDQTVLDETDLFALQLTLGKKLNMPVIVHSRRGFKETSDVLKAVKWNKGVVHGYAYSKSELDFFLDSGWYISFSGAVTYAGKKGAQDMSDTVTYVPKDRLLIESDSPYYAPVPLKNTENTPLNMKYIYDYIASKRGISTGKLSDTVDENFKRLFL